MGLRATLMVQGSEGYPNTLKVTPKGSAVTLMVYGLEATTWARLTLLILTQK